MKKKRIIVLVLLIILALLCFTFVVVFGDYKEDGKIDIINADNNTSIGYRVGSAFSSFFKNEKPHKVNEDIVAYVNKLPVYKYELIERTEKLQALIKIYGSAQITNPVQYTFIEKYIEYYAKKNKIKITDKELYEYVDLMKKNTSNEPYFDDYIRGLGISRDEFWNDKAPEYYRKNLLKGRVGKEIEKILISKDKELENLFAEDLNKYVTEYYLDHMKVKIINKDFIKSYDNDADKIQ